MCCREQPLHEIAKKPSEGERFNWKGAEHDRMSRHDYSVTATALAV
jgi:hypothetical protein